MGNNFLVHAKHAKDAKNFKGIGLFESVFFFKNLANFAFFA